MRNGYYTANLLLPLDRLALPYMFSDIRLLFLLIYVYRSLKSDERRLTMQGLEPSFLI